MIRNTGDRKIRVLYELEVYLSTGEFWSRRFFTRKRRADQMMNLWKKHGFDVNLRKLNKSEFTWVSPDDIESEE